jgi:hypothetical protein
MDEQQQKQFSASSRLLTVLVEEVEEGAGLWVVLGWGSGPVLVAGRGKSGGRGRDGGWPRRRQRTRRGQRKG